MLALRRQRNGAIHLARTLHLNARWWNGERAKDGDLLYVALGDSAAQGVGASRPGRGYVGLVADHLRQRCGQTVRVVNLSVSGAKLGDAIELQLPALQQLKPDIVTIAIGANDIPGFEPERFSRELAYLLRLLPAGTIVAEVPAFYLGAAEASARAANRIIRRLATEHGFEVAPLHNRTRAQGAPRYALNQVAADFFHPNDRGYRVWASAFIPLINQMVAARQATDPDRADGGLA